MHILCASPRKVFLPSPFTPQVNLASLQSSVAGCELPLCVLSLSPRAGSREGTVIHAGATCSVHKRKSGERSWSEKGASGPDLCVCFAAAAGAGWREGLFSVPPATVGVSGRRLSRSRRLAAVPGRPPRVLRSARGFALARVRDLPLLLGRGDAHNTVRPASQPLR